LRRGQAIGHIAEVGMWLYSTVGRTVEVWSSNSHIAEVGTWLYSTVGQTVEAWSSNKVILLKWLCGCIQQ